MNRTEMVERQAELAMNGRLQSCFNDIVLYDMHVTYHWSLRCEP